MKKIYLYGAGVVGLSYLNYCMNISSREEEIAGIIDARGKELFNYSNNYCGVTIYQSVEEIPLNEIDKVIIAVSTPGSERVIRNKLIEYGILENNIESIPANNVYIDISGKCNLACKSCQVSNRDTKYVNYKARGFMDAKLYESIIVKIKNEIPECRYVFLYDFGEPLLNPYICEILEITHKYGLFGIISTNLSVKIDFKKLIASKPDCIKVSLSGYSQRVYESTHCGGNIELVKDNIRMINQLRGELNITTPVIVGYHEYINNVDEVDLMKSFCHDNNVLFQKTEAIYMNRVKQWKELPYDELDISFVNEVYSYPEDKLYPNSCEMSEYPTCGFIDDGLFIDYEGNIILCCNVLDDRAKYGKFLEQDLTVANEKRRNSEFCKVCKSYGMHWPK